MAWVLLAGRFRSSPFDEKYLRAATRYVERNPVRGQLVRHAWDYQWSSARWHLGLNEKSLIYLTEANILDKADWKEYLMEVDQDFENDFRAKTRKGSAIGDTDFIAKMEERTGRVLHSLKAGRKRSK